MSVGVKQPVNEFQWFLLISLHYENSYWKHVEWVTHWLIEDLVLPQHHPHLWRAAQASAEANWEHTKKNYIFDHQGLANTWSSGWRWRPRPRLRYGWSYWGND